SRIFIFVLVTVGRVLLMVQVKEVMQTLKITLDLDNTTGRMRRKQSNRESARRSRLRKQAECDELAQRAEVLNEENASLREEINKLRSQCEELTSENTSLKYWFGSCRTNFYHSLHLKALTQGRARTTRHHSKTLAAATTTTLGGFLLTDG
ncbi:unnamed protein product, partial [Brassica oleracea var. botrytis]